MSPLELHKRIREFIEKGFESADFAYLKDKLFVNDDSKKYFYSRIDKNWIKDLEKKGFFKVLNKKAEDPHSIAYRIPELIYLIEIAEQSPVEVVDIICDTKILRENFNPEVIERFIWIMSKLPVDQLKRVIIKMKDEKWFELMSGFRKTGYEFASVVEILVKENDEQGLTDLLEAIVTICNKMTEGYRDSIFYVSDIYASDIFVAVGSIKNQENILKSLNFLLGQLDEAILKHGIKYTESESVFDYDGPFSFYGKNIFNLKIEGRNAFSYNLDESNMIALIIDLMGKIEKNNTGEILKKLDTLPNCEIVWKLKLVFLAAHNDSYNEELYKKVSSLFDYGNNYGAIDHGSEYKYAVNLVFSSWGKPWQEEYVTEAIKFFKKQIKDNPKESWHTRNAKELLTIAYVNTSDTELKRTINTFADNLGIELDSPYDPNLETPEIISGYVQHRTPFEISSLEVSGIFNNLKTNWAPDKINEEFKNDDLLSPRSPEGLGDALKENLKVRFDDYLECMLSESEYKNINPHYVSSLLRGFEDLFRDENKKWSIEEIDSILKVLIKLKSQGVVDGDLSEKDNSWLGTWLTVKRSMADVLIYIIEPKDKELRQAVHTKNKYEIFDLLVYLFKTPESPNTKHEEPDYGDPFHVAINSVRGRVYQGFVVYIENDGKTLSDECKEFFQNALKDTSTAVRFVIGYYLPSIYYRDTEFVSELFPTIFPKDLSDKLASWEGYLNQSLYKELYTELKEYYLWFMDVTPPERKYTKDINEVLSAHIALDFVHFQENHTTGLVWDFLERKNIKQIEEFISFVGRSYVEGDSLNKNSLDHLPGGLNKFMVFWDWVIEQKFRPDTYGGFGFWVNSKVIDIEILIDKLDKTFELSNGSIDWDYKFEKSLVEFADTDPKKTLNIIKNYLLQEADKGYVLNNNRKYPIFSIEGEIKSALETIYKKTELKTKVEELINLLIENGGQVFWSLENILVK